MNPNVHELVEILDEEQKFCALAAQVSNPAAPPPFLAIRYTKTLRETIDPRILNIVSGDTTRILLSQRGVWYWLLLDITNQPHAKVQAARDQLEDNIIQVPPGFWHLARPINTIFDKRKFQPHA